jgi:hypothetical protein
MKSMTPHGITGLEKVKEAGNTVEILHPSSKSKKLLEK